MIARPAEAGVTSHPYWRFFFLCALLLGLLAIAALWSLGTGSTSIGWHEIIAWAMGRPLSPEAAQILWELRLPRLLLAILAGAGYGVASIPWGTEIGWAAAVCAVTTAYVRYLGAAAGALSTVADASVSST